MLPSERQEKVFQLLASRGIVTIPELMAEYKVSIETVRRDLAALEKQGKIEKVYGGARVRQMPGEPEMESRMTGRLPQKQAIGKKCSEYINDGDCIFIDSGSTAYNVSKYISNKKKLTVITNSIPVVNELMETEFEIIVIGGRVRHEERSVVTYEHIFDFSQLNIQKSFIGAGGITVENGISDYNMQEAVTRKMILERSRDIYVVADSSKFGKDVTINVVPISKIDYIITDSQLSKGIADEFKKNKANIVLAQIE